MTVQLTPDVLKEIRGQISEATDAIEKRRKQLELLEDLIEFRRSAERHLEVHAEGRWSNDSRKELLLTSVPCGRGKRPMEATYGERLHQMFLANLDVLIQEVQQDLGIKTGKIRKG